MQYLINQFLAKDPIESQGLPIDFWNHVHLSADRFERSSSQFNGDVLSNHFIYFLDRNYSYKSILTEIPHDAGLSRSHTLAENCCLTGDQTRTIFSSTSTRQFALDCVTTGLGLTF